MDPVEERMSAASGEEASHRDREAEFYDAWETFVRATRRSRGRANASADGSLTLSQYHLVKALEAGPRPSMELAEIAGVTGATSSRVLDVLERRGIVARHISPSDGRVVMVTLTGPGRRIVARMHGLVDAKRRAVYLSLDPEDRERAARLLSHLAEGMELTDP